MLLDALLAATDRLIVTYTGNDERTNVPRPPAVPVGRAARRRRSHGARRRTATTRARASSCATRCSRSTRATSTPGESCASGRGASTASRSDGARAIVGPRAGDEPFLRAPLADAAGPVVELDGLVKFVERPVRAFLRQRLGISVADYDEDVADALPVELDGLEVWAVGQRLVDGLLARRASSTRASRPRSRAGRCRRARSARRSSSACGRRWRGSPRAAAALLGAAGEPGSVEVNALIGDGRFLRGTAPGVRGDVLGAVTYSRVSPRHRLAAWVRLLALTASHPQRPFEAVTIGRARSDADQGARVTIARIAVLGDDARSAASARWSILRTLIDVYDRGMREALPIACLSSAAYAQAARARREPGGGGARGVGVDVELRPRGPRARPPARARRRAHARRAARRAAARRRAGRRLGRGRDDALRALRAARVGRPAGAARRSSTGERARSPRRGRSTSAGRCRPASPCSRPAPAPARRSRSPRSRRATSPRARRWTRSCS